MRKFTVVCEIVFENEFKDYTEKQISEEIANMVDRYDYGFTIDKISVIEMKTNDKS